MCQRTGLNYHKINWPKDKVLDIIRITTCIDRIPKSYCLQSQDSYSDTKCIRVKDQSTFDG